MARCLGSSRSTPRHLLALALALWAPITFATDASHAATPTLDPNGIRFDVSEARWLLTVSGPEGFYERREHTGTTPSLLVVPEDGQATDGTYFWELRSLDARAGEASGVSSGSFYLTEGRIALPSGESEVSDGEDTPPAPPPFVPTHSGDVSIDGKMCVGTDCSDVTPIGIEAIRMIQNNAWFEVEDTSSTISATHPSVDWRLKFNDSTPISTGGTNHFALEDRGDDGGSATSIFRVDAGAPVDSLRVVSNGRVGLGTSTPSAQLHVMNDALVEGNFSAGSSREIKHAFAPVDARAILERLVELPISEWSYRRDDPDVRHLGPVAEDFAAMFGLGETDRHVSPVDLSGVAFAAIQGLHKIVRERNVEIETLKHRLAALEARLYADDERP